MNLEEFKKKVEDTKVECRLCHRKFFALAEHLDEIHHISVGSYRAKYPDAEVTSSVVKALIKAKPRTRVVTGDVLDQIWDKLVDFRPRELATIGSAMKHNSPELIPSVDQDYILPQRESSVVALAVAEGMNLFTSGPTECGKTSLVEQTHAAMGRPLMRCNMTGDTTVKNFVGQTQLNEKGTFFQEGLLIKAMKLGVTLLIDEIDFMPPHIGAVLHPVLERGRSLYVPDLGQTIKAEKGFTVVATANTGGKGDRVGIYTGTEVLNTAFLDRFQLRLEMDYLPEDKERAVLEGKFPDLAGDFIKDLVSFAKEIRQSFRQGSVEVTLGARKLDDFLRVHRKMGFEAAYRLVIEDWLSEEEKALVREIRTRVWGATVPGTKPKV